MQPVELVTPEPESTHQPAAHINIGLLTDKELEPQIVALGILENTDPLENNLPEAASQLNTGLLNDIIVEYLPPDTALSLDTPAFNQANMQPVELVTPEPESTHQPAAHINIDLFNDKELEPQIVAPGLENTDPLAINLPEAASQLNTGLLNDVIVEYLTPDTALSFDTPALNQANMQLVELVTPENAAPTNDREGIRRELFPILTQDEVDNFDPNDTLMIPLEPIEETVEMVPPNRRRRNNVEPAETPPKKRRVNKPEWLDSKRKQAHNLGQEFINKNGKTMRARVMKPPCDSKCKRKCSSFITETTRQAMFAKYWSSTDKVVKWLFLGKLIKVVPVKQRKVAPTDDDIEGEEYYRKHTYEYYLPNANGENVQVCQKIFLNTFDISVTAAKSSVNKNSPDKRGQSRGSHHNRLHAELVQSVKDHVKSFPVVESHYCRKDTRKRYLDDHLSVAKMHRLYLMGRGENSPHTATLRQYRDIFNGSFNLGFYKPKKDLCSFCVEYDGLSEEKKNDPARKKAYDTHIRDKELVRELKKNDKIASREEGSNVLVVTFDLQKVFFLPLCDVGECFYKRKVSCYDFTIFNCTEKAAHCYVWDQTIGGRESGEFASALLHFMESEVINKGVKEFQFYSDSCSSQNKNQFLFSMYYMAAMKFDIKIRHRYLIKGHTQMECDSVHGRIEKKTFRQQIFTPSQWYGHIKTAKVKPPLYNVKEVKREDIFTFKELAERFCWSSQGVSKFREVVIDSKKPGKASFRTNLSEEPKEVNILVKSRGRPLNWKTYKPPLAHNGKIPLKQKLIKDLKWYVQNNVIPAAHIPYYDSLTQPIAENIEDDDEDDVPEEINPEAEYQDRSEDEDDPEENVVDRNNNMDIISDFEESDMDY